MEQSPACLSLRSISGVRRSPFVTIPHGNPREEMPCAHSTMSSRTSGSPPPSMTNTSPGLRFWAMLSSTRKKSSRGMSGVRAACRQSLPQCRQWMLQRTVLSQNSCRSGCSLRRLLFRSLEASSATVLRMPSFSSFMLQSYEEKMNCEGRFANYCRFVISPPLRLPSDIHCQIGRHPLPFRPTWQ